LNQVIGYSEANTTDYSAYAATNNLPTPGVTTFEKEIIFNSLGQEFFTEDTTRNSWTSDLVTVLTRSDIHYNLDNKLFTFDQTDAALDDGILNDGFPGAGLGGAILNSVTTTFRDLTLYNAEGLEQQTVDRILFYQWSDSFL
jgi:hypothetical protein